MGASGTGNIVNIEIKTSNESLALNPEAIPLQNIDGGSGKIARMNFGGRRE
jgi:hypothetical protein